MGDELLVSADLRSDPGLDSLRKLMTQTLEDARAHEEKCTAEHGDCQARLDEIAARLGRDRREREWLETALEEIGRW